MVRPPNKIGEYAELGDVNRDKVKEDELEFAKVIILLIVTIATSIVIVTIVSIIIVTIVIVIIVIMAGSGEQSRGCGRQGEGGRHQQGEISSSLSLCLVSSTSS